MIDVLNKQCFHLYNDNISLILHVLNNHQLGQLYFGKRVSHFDEQQMVYYLKKENKAAGSAKFSIDDSLLSLGDTMQAYPVFGTSDFRDGAIDIYDQTTPLYLNFEYQNYRIENEIEKIPGLPTSRNTGDSQTLIITLLDCDAKIQIEMYFTIFSHCNVVSRYQKITNLNSHTLTITKAMSASLDLPTADYKFVHLSGGWLKERQVKKNNLEQGIVSVGSLRGASSHQQNPFIALESKDATLTHGDVIGMNLIYSGNFIGQVEVDEWNRTRIMIGIHPQHFSWQLKTNKTFYTPEAIISYSSEGLSGLSRENSKYIYDHIINPKWHHKEKPIVFNSWEAAYYDFDEDLLLDLAKKSKELGMDCFVIDDGWFGQRNNDRSSLGDWFVNEKKFLHGIQSFAKKIHQMNMKLGIWFEPEMISPDSKLYQEHPDWAVIHASSRHSIARGQYVLDFANPAVVDNIFAQMCKIIDETQLDYIKWDMNRNITEAYSTYLKLENIDQREFYHRYILGLYHLYDLLLEKYPDLLIEGCAGGGGRFDLGILYYSPQIWVSDDSDAVERLKIQFGTALAYPMISLSNHVSAIPNHQIYRETSLNMRYHVAMFGQLGYELNLNELTNIEQQCIKQQIKDYKEKRKIFDESEFYLLESPFESNEVKWAILSKDRNDILLGFYRIQAEANCRSEDFIKIPFVNDDDCYEVEGHILSGSLLKTIGLRQPYQFNGANHATVQLKGDYQSYIYHLKKV